MENAICVRNLYKYFNNIPVIKSVDFTLKKGEIHAIIGKNGAGKSTLIKILAGIYRADLGEIYVNDEIVNIKTPYDSVKEGISVAHQNLDLFDDLSVAENIFLGNFSSKIFGIVSQSNLLKRAIDLFKKYEIKFDCKKKVKQLSMGEKHFVVLARILSQDSNIIILDEIASALTEGERDKLFNIIKLLKEKGYSIIYITHNIAEIFKFADRVSVLRDGEIVDTKNISEANNEELARSMVGLDLKKRYPKLPVKKGETILQVKNLSFNLINNISFSLRKGEILGITGLMGSGRSIIAKCLFGILRPDEGEIFYHGKKIKIKNQHDAVKQGICYIPEDRVKEGVLSTSDIRFNISIAHLQAVEREKIRWMVDNKVENERVSQYLGRLGVEYSGLDQPAVELSSGNQQKIIIARWLMANSNVLIMDEPTKDLDIASKVEVYNLMNEMVREGKGILFVSSDFTELTGMCDRILVLKKGQITCELSREEATKDKILKNAL